MFPSFVSLVALALPLVFVVAWSPSLVAWFFWVGQDVYKFRKCILFLLVVGWLGVCGCGVGVGVSECGFRLWCVCVFTGLSGVSYFFLGVWVSE